MIEGGYVQLAVSILRDYLIVILAIIIGATLLIYKYISVKRKMGRENELLANKPVLQKLANMRDAPTELELKSLDDEFQMTFGKKKEVIKEKEDTVDWIKKLTDKVGKDKEVIDKSTIEEFNNLKRQLKEVQTNKEQVRTYGKELARIFHKYEEREMYLIGLLNGLERMIEKNQQE